MGMSIDSSGSSSNIPIDSSGTIGPTTGDGGAVAPTGGEGKSKKGTGTAQGTSGKPQDLQEGDVGLHKNAALLDQVANQGEDLKALVEKFAKGKSASELTGAKDAALATEDEQDEATQAGQPANALLVDTLKAATTELLTAIEDISTKMQSVGTEGSQQVEFFASDEFTNIVNEFQSKTVDIPKQMIDNLTMGAPVIGPPVGGSVIDAKMTGGKTINAFLGGNPMVAFLTAYMEMIMMLKDIQRAELGVTIAGLNNTMALAQGAASAIKSSAEAEAMMHFGMAAIAAVQLTVTVGMAAMQARAINTSAKNFDQSVVAKQEAIAQDKMILKTPATPKTDTSPGSPAFGERYTPNSKFKSTEPPSNGPQPPANYKYIDKNNPNGDGTNDKSLAQTETFTPSQREIDGANARIQQNESELTSLQGSRGASIIQNAQTQMQQYQTISQMSQQGGEIFSNALQGIMKLNKAQYDALLQLIQGYQQIQRTMTDKSSDAQKQAIEQISQLCQSLVKMSDQLYKAFGFSTR